MNSTINLTPDVIEVLDAARINGNSLELVGQLSRDLYLRTNKALEALGGKWNKKAKAHLFEIDPAEAIENAVLTGSVRDTKKELDYFPTPVSVARQIIDLAEIGDSDRVLEPSAGEGAILAVLRDYGRHHGNVDVCEIDERRRATLATLPNVTIAAVDFLSYQPGAIYDRIIANPPFSLRRDLEHVRHMWELLAPGGRLVSVMASGIVFRTDAKTRALHDLIPNSRMYPLEDNAFKESGTGVNTVIFVASKPAR